MRADGSVEVVGGYFGQAPVDGSACTARLADQRDDSAGRCRTRVAARRRTADDALDRPRRTEQRATGLPAPADGADRLAEPQRRVELPRPVRCPGAARPTAGVLPRADPGSVSPRVGAVRHRPPQRRDVVPPDIPDQRQLAGSAGAAALRCSRPDRDGMGQRSAGGAPRRWLHRIQCRHHPGAAARRTAGDRRAGRGSQRSQPLPGGQAAQSSRRALLHRFVGDLADHLARAGARRPP